MAGEARNDFDEAHSLLNENYASDGAKAEPPGFWTRIAHTIGSGYPHEPWEWTKTYPNFANFLRNALQTAPLAFPAVRPPSLREARKLTPFEWPMHAAVRIGDRTFTGN